MEELMNNELINTSAIETIDSREVAEMVDMEHKNLLSKIRKYVEILDGSKLSSPQFFVPSTYVNNQNKEQPCYLLTKKGCEMVANKLTGEKGVIFTAKYVNRFAEMEQKIKLPKTDREILFLSVKVQEQTAQRVDVLEEKVTALEETTTTINSSQQYTLERIAKTTVISALGGIDSRAYQLMSRKLFSNIWRDYKKYFKLGSYRDTLKTDYENAKNYLESWSPEVNISLKIKEYNSQLSMILD